MLEERSLREEVDRKQSGGTDGNCFALLRLNSVFSFPLAGWWLAAEDRTAR
jgi:hypothetical protein